MKNVLTEAGASRRDESAEYDAIVIGAGFAGMYMLYRLRQLGMRVCVFERGTMSAALGIGTGILVAGVTLKA
ncbi:MULTISPECIES: NAD(P)-binding protein [unclassified Methylibium]|uniref:NAD(P)-binding protein n=1 Tax=unclassified Methylibium TaxID=2633235 RepID=UPI0003F42ED7|nr:MULTISPECIES: NAD(P)-binding protein [unclassified Methylibium]EWS53969.1 Phenylacetone monooxygenase [Methylibium sp. T29]EWS58290.1 Phenylacetone monooxygenase [Methylibium sp. T29-B]